MKTKLNKLLTLVRGLRARAAALGLCNGLGGKRGAAAPAARNPSASRARRRP